MRHCPVTSVPFRTLAAMHDVDRANHPDPRAARPLPASATVIVQYDDGSAEVLEIDGRTADITQVGVTTKDRYADGAFDISLGDVRVLTGRGTVTVTIQAHHRSGARAVPGMPPPEDPGRLFQLRRLTPGVLPEYLATMAGAAETALKPYVEAMLRFVADAPAPTGLLLGRATVAWMTSVLVRPLAEPAVGGWAYLPERYGEHVPDIANQAGQVVSIEDGWAMVDRGQYGQIGCPVGDLLWTLSPAG